MPEAITVLDLFCGVKRAVGPLAGIMKIFSNFSIVLLELKKKIQTLNSKGNDRRTVPVVSLQKMSPNAPAPILNPRTPECAEHHFHHPNPLRRVRVGYGGMQELGYSGTFVLSCTPLWHVRLRSLLVTMRGWIRSPTATDDFQFL